MTPLTLTEVENPKRYAAMFVDAIDTACQEASAKIAAQVLDDLNKWKLSGKNTNLYQASYGIDNLRYSPFGITRVAERSLFSQGSRFVELKAKEIWNQYKLSLGSSVNYYDYKIECHLATLDKLITLIQQKFNETTSLSEKIKIEKELRECFLTKKNKSCALWKHIAFSLVPVLGWSFALTYPPPGKYDGEALIRISIE